MKAICAAPNCEELAFNGEPHCLIHGPRTRTEANSRSFGDERICPHCQVRGQVTSRRMKQKKGVSGAKATGAIFTAGLSLLGTGLSRKEYVTEMRCGNCRTTWTI